VRIFKNTWFARFAAKGGITDGELRELVNQLETKQTDAYLGGGVYKMRLARPGEGKAGGYRVIVLFRSGYRTFYVYGFTKSDRSNISSKELQVFKEAAKEYLSMTAEHLDERIKNGQIVEL